MPLKKWSWTYFTNWSHRHPTAAAISFLFGGTSVILGILSILLALPTLPPSPPAPQVKQSTQQTTSVTINNVSSPTVTGFITKDDSTSPAAVGKTESQLLSTPTVEKPHPAHSTPPHADPTPSGRDKPSETVVQYIPPPPLPLTPLDKNALFVDSSAGSGGDLAQTFSRQLADEGFTIASKKADGGLSVEIIDITTESPREDKGRYLTWLATVAVRIIVKDTTNNSVLLTNDFVETHSAADPRRAYAAALVQATRDAARFLDRNRKAIQSR